MRLAEVLRVEAWTEEMTQWLRVFAAHPEEPCSVPSTHIVQSKTTPVIAAPGHGNSFLSPVGISTYTYTPTHIIKNKILKKNLISNILQMDFHHELFY